jgi:hypothetical protein
MRGFLSNNFIVWLAIGGAIIALPETALSFDPDPVAKVIEPGDREIELAVQDLASDQYLVRERASRLLGGSGTRAVKALAAGIDSEHLEVACRAVAILQGLYLNTDDVTSSSAEDLLEKFSESPNRPVARRALSALGSQEAVRQERAKKRIEELGGEVSFDGPQTAMFRINNFQNGVAPVDNVIIEPDWKGGDAGLLLIRRLGDVRTLYLVNDPPVSAEAVKRLEESMPGLKRQNRGGKLGMAGQTHKLGALISMIPENSPAVRAGLKVGDLIRKYDGQPLMNEGQGSKGWELLIELNLKRKPGDKVRLEILRDSQEEDDEDDPPKGTNRKPPKIVQIEVADPRDPDKLRSIEFVVKDVELTLGSWKKPAAK